MKLPPTDKFDSLTTVQTFFDESADGMLLIDRRGRVHLANRAIEQMMERPNREMIEESFGDALSCIHTGDHPDGCGYGSICSDCFLHRAVKQALRTRKPVEDAEGILAIGLRDKGVVRPNLKSNIAPVSLQRRMYLIMSLGDSIQEEE